MNDTNSFESPPPAIASERVLHYARLDDSVGFNAGHRIMFVDDKELGRVPCLAICEAKKSSKSTLFYCENDWQFVAASVHDSIAAAKARAEHLYPGSLNKWVEAKFSQQDVDLYLDQVWTPHRCSFCGKRPDQGINSIFQGDGNANICDKCVLEMYKELEKKGS
jgi:ClpX C4-type zinc finger